jgi:hypothetical protein
MEDRLDGAISCQNNQTDTRKKAPATNRLMKKTIKKFWKAYYCLGTFATWRKENNLLFYVLAFNFDMHPGPLLVDLSRSLGSGMVVEDHRSTEGVILEFLETYNDGTTTILCSLNKQYGLPDKSTSNQRLQFVSHKSE